MIKNMISISRSLVFSVHDQIYVQQSLLEKLCGGSPVLCLWSLFTGRLHFYQVTVIGKREHIMHIVFHTSFYFLQHCLLDVPKQPTCMKLRAGELYEHIILSCAMSYMSVARDIQQIYCSAQTGQCWFARFANYNFVGKTVWEFHCLVLWPIGIIDCNLWVVMVTRTEDGKVWQHTCTKYKKDIFNC